MPGLQAHRRPLPAVQQRAVRAAMPGARQRGRRRWGGAPRASLAHEPWQGQPRCGRALLAAWAGRVRACLDAPCARSCPGPPPCAGLTLLLDDAGRLPWLQDVQAPAVAGGSAPGCPPGAAGSSLPPPPPLCLDWAVSLLGSAVRYEPRDSSMVAALLTISSLAWAAGPGQPQSSVQAKRLSLHLAAARQPEAPGDARGGGPARVPCSVPPSAPEVAGFHQVAAEAGLTLRMPWPRPPQQEGVTAAAVREVALSSSALSLSLSRHTLSLLRRLLDQLAAQRGNSSEGPPPHGSSSEGASPRGSIGGEGVPSRRGVGGGVDVMRDVVQAAYAAPPRPQERPAEASVFLDGGRPACLPWSLGCLLPPAPCPSASLQPVVASRRCWGDRPLSAPAQLWCTLACPPPAGGWYDAEGAPSSGSFAMSPAGSPPAVVGRDWLQGFAEGRCARQPSRRAV
jgi:hypothetical protein